MGQIGKLNVSLHRPFQRVEITYLVVDFSFFFYFIFKYKAKDADWVCQPIILVTLIKQCLCSTQLFSFTSILNVVAAIVECHSYLCVVALSFVIVVDKLDHRFENLEVVSVDPIFILTHLCFPSILLLNSRFWKPIVYIISVCCKNGRILRH